MESDPTIVQLLSQAWGMIDSIQSSGHSASKREFALAKTAIEDAVMRTNRAFSFYAGSFAPTDVESELRDRG